MRILPLLAALAAGLPTAALAQGFGVTVDETAGGGREEAAALYFAPPPTEEAEAVISADRTQGAGAVQLAIALGQVEEALGACRDLRGEMQELIGDTYGSYSVNPGWLRRYQACVVQRADEAKMLGTMIQARQTELISRLGEEDDETVAGEAMRAADLMARLAARQSAVRLAIAREGRKQRAFVRYYNTGERPAELDEPAPAPAVRVPAGEKPLDGPAPIRIDPATRPETSDETDPNADLPFGGAILRDGEAIEGADDAGTDDEGASLPAATGGPVTLRARD